jgi:hypothetical protein
MKSPEIGLVPRLILATTLVGSVIYHRDGSVAHAADHQPAPITTSDTLRFGTHLGEIQFIQHNSSVVEGSPLEIQINSDPRTSTPVPTSRIEYLMPVIPNREATATLTPTPSLEEDDDDSEERERKNRGNTNRRLKNEQKNDKSDKSSRGKNNQNNGGNSEHLHNNGSEIPSNNQNDNDKRFCGQAETEGYNPQTGETQIFPTTCLPDGWVRVDNRRATPTATLTPTSIVFCPAEFPSRCGTPGSRP